MKSIGILYIATGQYIVFWKEFYESFEQNFLPDIEKHYYVFTDAKQIIGEDNPRVHTVYQESFPWPMPTLLKFHFFLKIEDELKKHDYLYQSNGPIQCVKEVHSKDFLPREDLGEKLFFNIHPGYCKKQKWKWPYDRNESSMAYVPYNKGNVYVFGAMNGGLSAAYIEMMHVLDKQIKLDLNHGIIARFHDESYINHYIIDRNDYRILPVSYAYPSGMEIQSEKCIVCIDKEKYIPVREIKGIVSNKDIDFFAKIHRAIRKRYVFIEVVRDNLFRRRM